MAITLGGTAYYHFTNGVIPRAFSMWMKTTSTTMNQVPIAQSDTTNNTNGWTFAINNTEPGRLKLQIKDNTNTIVSDYYSAVTNFNDGNWHHIAGNLYFTNGSSSEIWLDGVLVTSGPCTAAWMPTGSVGLTVGKSPTNFAAWTNFPGAVADVALFSVNLSAAQIWALSRGFSAKRVLPYAICANAVNGGWMPIIRHTSGSNEEDEKTRPSHAGAAILSNTGSESYTDHPRMYF